MKPSTTLPPPPHPWKQLAVHALAIAAGALVLCWPALWNRFPLFFADEAQYLVDGRNVLLQLLGRPYSPLLVVRSEIYSAAIFLAYGYVTAWISLAQQALLTSWVLWLVVRSIFPRRPGWLFPAITTSLAVLTGVSWYVSFLTPDFLCPLLFLSLYLLIFAPETLRRWEQCALMALAWFATVAHATHLLLVLALCALLGVGWLAGWEFLRHRRRSLLIAMATVLLAIAAQMGLHLRFYGHPSLFGPSAPFLTARLIEDGPARLYLQNHCATLPWLLCRDLNELPPNGQDFLWKPGGIWQTASPEQKLELRREEMPLVIATLRTYPRRQLLRSSSNFLHELVNFGPDSDFGPMPLWNIGVLPTFILQINSGYPQSLQARDAMPESLFRSLQLVAIAASLLAVAFLLPPVWRRRPRLSTGRLAGLSVITLFVVPANALVTGVLSGLFARYQGRIAWLLMLLALLLACDRWIHRNSTSPTPIPSAQ